MAKKSKKKLHAADEVSGHKTVTVHGFYRKGTDVDGFHRKGGKVKTHKRKKRK